MDELTKKIRELKFEKGYSNSQISKELGVTIEKTKRVTCKSYDEIIKRKENKEKCEKEFVELVKQYLPFSNSLNHLCNNLGLKGVDGYYKKLKRIIKEYDLSTEHFGTIRPLSNGGNIMTDEEFFVEGQNRSSGAIIKRLIEGGYKKYKCENCNINEWDGKPLRLQIHHINGDHSDNRIENLQLLCPNCHTQTDTYARHNTSKNSGFVIKNIEELKDSIEHIKPKYCKNCGKEITNGSNEYCSHECAQKASRKFEVSSTQLIEDFKELKSFTAVGRKYNVSDNAIKRRAKKLGVYEEVRQFITPR
jgi:Zn finger protein HypA/HybF involved in hydrogenase expression